MVPKTLSGIKCFIVQGQIILALPSICQRSIRTRFGTKNQSHVEGQKTKTIQTKKKKKKIFFQRSDLGGDSRPDRRQSLAIFHLVSREKLVVSRC